MSKENNIVNKGQDHELNYHLEKNGFRETEQNRNVLRSLTPNNSSHEKVDDIIKANKSKFEAKK